MTTPQSDLPYLSGYPPELLEQARELLTSGQLADMLGRKYPQKHDIHSNKALFSYVQELKAQHMRKAAPLDRVNFDDRMHAVHNALGLHIEASRVHGTKVRKRRELKVASVFKQAPADFLRMIVVHELAHMKHREHDRDFYRLCVHMEPEYHQLELDMRLYLTSLDWG